VNGAIQLQRRKSLSGPEDLQGCDVLTPFVVVNAVCINQGNDAEKSHQVLLMTDIYANASRVIAWIGKPGSLSGLAFDTLERFAADDGTLDGSVTYQKILDRAEEGERQLNS
jgi:hypothetical protein